MYCVMWDAGGLFLPAEQKMVGVLVRSTALAPGGEEVVGSLLHSSIQVLGPLKGGMAVQQEVNALVALFLVLGPSTVVIKSQSPSALNAMGVPITVVMAVCARRMRVRSAYPAPD